MKNLSRHIHRLLTLLVFMTSLTTVAYAAVVDSVLTGIEVTPVNGSYEITVNTNKPVPIKTRTLSNNKMYIDLKGITPSKSINTVYKNAANIDHVLIQPMGENIRVVLKGDNVGSSQVLLNTSKIPLNLLNTRNEKKTLVLNRSIKSYKPLQEEVEEPIEEVPETMSIVLPTSINWNAIATPSNLGWIMGLCFMLLFLSKTLKETKEKQKQTAKISFRTPPEEIAKKNDKARKELELDLQKELSIAHNRFQESMIRKQGLPPQNAFNQSMGIKEYQNSQSNPFKKVSKKPQAPNPVNNLNELKSLLKQKETLAGGVNLATEKPSANEVRKSQVRMNNMKFLENMKDIYEENGRVDLASSISEQMKLKQKRDSMKRSK